MPQFDFFIWFSLSLWTIFSFQILYYFLLYFIIARFSNFQKTLIKLHLLSKKFLNKKNLKVLDYLFKKFL